MSDEKNRTAADLSPAEQWALAEHLEGLAREVVVHVAEAMGQHGSMASAHEGWAVILEEVDELWDHVKTKQSKRDQVAMRMEAMQVAAMAIRFLYDICRKDAPGYGK